MSNSKIAFPNKINNARLIGPLGADTVSVVFVSFFVFFLLTSFLLKDYTMAKYAVTLIATAVALYVFLFYKKNAKKGFLLHWLYVRSIYLPKYKGFEGLPSNFLPKGYEYEFRD